MFTHLHVHSHYSLLDGLSKIDELIAQAKEYKMKSLALTDHGVMYGVIEFYQKAKEAGLKPIIGVETYVARNGRLNKRSKIDERPYHLVLLAKNEQGYKNLIKLISLAHLEGFYYKPRIDFELLKKYAQGLIALTACQMGEIPQLILEKQKEKAEKRALEYQDLFGKENFYLEVQDRYKNKNQNLINKALFEIGEKHHLPIVATNDVHYTKKEDAEIQDILICLQTKKKKQDQNRMSYLGDDFSLRSEQEMKKSFKGHPEVIANTEKIAAMCNLEIELNKIKLPDFPVPKNKTADEYLKNLCEQRFFEHYPKKTKEISSRLDYELEIIKKTGFASYFLIVQDFVNWAKKNNIVVGPGRGSAAGSIVSYLLNITNVNPLKYDLIFERFLNPERINMPDIDLDFTDTRRDEVIDYVEKKYGRDHVAQIITFGTMAARAAIRDVGRVLDYPYIFCDKLAKMVPFGLSLKKALEASEELRETYNHNPDAKNIIDPAKKLEGVARHASKHACGVVIAPKTIDQYVPTQYDVSGKEKTIITQYEMHAIEDLGLLKMDFLGLKNLTIIERTLKLIRYRYNEDIDINKISLEDAKTFKLLQKAETTGVFQLESSGMQRYLKQLKPTSFEDIIAMVSLYRPGPMELIPDYIAGKHGTKIPHYIHPKLKPILDKTFGIAIYQEQILQTARDLAGFSFSEADVLRKAVGKKIPKLLKEQKEKFIKGCINNKISKEIAEKIFAFIEPFAGYGFNRSHATCYATIAYQTAYLKANYPTEFMAALLIAHKDDTDRIAIEVDEAKKIGIDVLPPDINESYKNFTVINKKNIRFGLSAIKNIGEEIVKTIIKEREENGRFQNLENFLGRIDSKNLNKKSLESLIKSGTLDQFGERNNLLNNTDILLEFIRKKQKDNHNGQTTLFGLLPKNNNSVLNFKESPAASHQQKLLWEKEFLGFFVSEHPLEEYRELIKKYVTPINQIKLSNKSIKILGLITKIKKINTTGNQNMYFVKIDDSFGEIETLIFPKILKTTIEIWQENKIVCITGRISDKDGQLKIIAEEAKEVSKESLDNLLLKLK
ncbi:MAG: DNA polymerase III subunit alpha [Patescibacteria group bacterium]|nr:DNA polymerase III subunit alpha [Patescibacteria group bacterium]